jgi:hypothetical protein
MSCRFNPACGAALRAAEARNLQQGRAASSAEQANADEASRPTSPDPSVAALRLPHPDPARLHASGVEPARGPAFPLLISNRADANQGVQP